MATNMKSCSRKGIPNRFSNTGVMPDAYREYSKHVPWKERITRTQFRDIIEACSSWIILQLLRGAEVLLPENVGSLSVGKKKYEEKSDNRIDWFSTKRLWEEDDECAEEKRLVRFDEEYIYGILYLSNKSKLKQRKLHKFKASRLLKKMLKKQIKNGRTYGDSTIKDNRQWLNYLQA